MSKNRTNFYLLRIEFIRLYVNFNAQNPEIDPMKNKDFIHCALALFNRHYFFSEEMYEIYSKKVQELPITDKIYTKDHHKMMAIELMKDWKNETIDLLNSANKILQ